MKTKLLFAALLITTITFAQTTKKGYDHYATSSANKKMNKSELIDAKAKKSKSSIKRYGKMGNHPDNARHNWMNNPSRPRKSQLNIRKKPGRTTNNNSTSKGILTPPKSTKATDYNSSRSNKRG